jgi:hypothetical protein
LPQLYVATPWDISASAQHTARCRLTSKNAASNAPSFFIMHPSWVVDLMDQ